MVRVVAVLAALGALAMSQLAGGATQQAGGWTVYVGEQSKAPAGTPKGTQLNQYFPGRLTVNAGDKVTFSSVGFHTVTHLGGKPFPPFLLPAKGQVYEGIADADGQPFYFDGEAKLANNMAIFGPAGPKAISRGKYATSGVLPAENPKKPVTAAYTFPQVGNFKLLCLIHPTMEMNVVVKPKGAALPATPEDVTAQANEDIDVAWAKAKALVAQKPPKNTIYMGVDSALVAGGRTDVLDFVPNLTTVKVGTRVNFIVKAPSEAHNAAFGPIKYIEKLIKQTDLFPEKPGDPNQATPFFLFGSDSPGTPYDGSTMHGNGFYATPLADGIKGAPPPASFSLRFTKPGKFHFICMLHGPDMAADIRVRK
jgi:plastocyanin